MIKLYKPLLNDLWFKQLMMSDEETMSYNHNYGGTIPFPKEMWETWYNKWLNDTDNTKFYRYLQDDNNDFIGEISYHFDSKINGYMCDVIIYAKYRNKGYGTQALKELCSIAKENNISILYDEIAIDNTAVNLFIKQGFTEINRTKDTIFLRKIL